MRSKDELEALQRKPLKEKIDMTQQRIKSWYENWYRYEIYNFKTGNTRFVSFDARDNNPWTYEPPMSKNEDIKSVENGAVYVSLSGGKDSTVLLNLVRDMYPNVEAVFVDTGLEYSQIRKFAMHFDNVTVIKPEMRFDEVIKRYGYPLISKQVSRSVHYARKAREQNRTNVDLLKMTGQFKDHFGNKSKFNKEKYLPLLDVDFRLSEQCCDVMKKKPAKEYSDSTGKMAITAQMACESDQRKEEWIMFGCNMFDNKYPMSNPMAFWTEQDVLRYIYENEIEICSVYGDVVHGNEQLNLDGQWITDFHTTGCSRTGCVFCGFGAHLYEEPPRFQLLKQLDPKKYNYCFSGGEFVDGVWQPNKAGLGMQYVYQQLNELYGNEFVKYK